MLQCISALFVSAENCRGNKRNLLYTCSTAQVLQPMGLANGAFMRSFMAGRRFFRDAITLRALARRSLSAKCAVC